MIKGAFRRLIKPYLRIVSNKINKVGGQPQTYPLIPNKALVSAGDGGDSDDNFGKRNYISIKNGIGWLHLDFKLKTKDGISWNTPLFEYPANCPRCIGIAEASLWDGASVFMAGRSIANDSLSKKVFCGSIADATVGRRYIINVVSFFEDEP